MDRGLAVLMSRGLEIITQDWEALLKEANAYALIEQGETMYRDPLEWDPEHLTIKGTFAYTGYLTAVVLERNGRPLFTTKFDPPIPVIMGSYSFDGVVELPGA